MVNIINLGEKTQTKDQAIFFKISEVNRKIFLKSQEKRYGDNYQPGKEMIN